MLLKCLMFKNGRYVEVQVFFTINKKSTIFVRFCSNFQRLQLVMSELNPESLSKIGQNCRFFINGEKTCTSTF